MKTIIMINGLARSGKDFTADLIQDILKQNNIKSSRVSFAKPLKEIIAKTFNISLEELDNFKNEGAVLYEGNDKVQISFRTILQRFGTEAMKAEFGNSVWAERGLINAQKELMSNDVVIITDFRFLIEDEFIRKDTSNIITIKVVDNNIKITEDHNHSSETELSKYNFDYLLDNTGHPDNTNILKEILYEKFVL